MSRILLSSPLVMLFIICLIFLFPLWKVVKRTGRSPWWSLLVFVPLVNIVGLWLLAYSKWPGVIETPILYGYPEEWKSFAMRHQQFTRRFVNIDKALHTAFQRIHQTTGPTERTIYFLGRLGVEEFAEVLLLCGNGYGIGAQKLIRRMYERAVTARYLFTHPEETDNYLAFHRVTDYKLMGAIQSSMSPDVFSPEMAQKVKAEYEAVKERFMVTDCKTCETKRLNYTWSKTDIVSMAYQDKILWPLVVPAYYLPMREFHSTMGAIFSRLNANATKEEGLLFDGAAQRDRTGQVIEEFESAQGGAEVNERAWTI